MAAQLIFDENDIDPASLEGVKEIGLTAGASTPEDVVQRCIKRLMDLGVTSVEDVVFTHEDVAFQLPKVLLEQQKLQKT